MEIKWEDNTAIAVKTDGGSVTVSANREGLLSLSGIFAALADEAPGSHVHLDAYNSLEDDSDGMIIEKTE